MDHTTESRSGTTIVYQPAKARVYSDEEWEAQKLNFETLYKENTLSQVIMAMKRDYGFVATKRQYKRKIEKWGIEKNIKGDEMLAIATQQLKRKREAGKESAFSIRDHSVREDKILRYMKRQKITESDLVLRDMPLQAFPNSSSLPEPLGELHHPNSENKVLVIPQQVDSHHSTISQRRDLVLCEDEVQFVFAPVPSRSGTYPRSIHPFLYDLAGSSLSLFPSKSGYKRRDFIPPPSPSLSDTASEALEAVSPILLPTMLSPAPPSTAFSPPDSTQHSVCIEDIFQKACRGGNFESSGSELSLYDAPLPLLGQEICQVKSEAVDKIQKMLNIDAAKYNLALSPHDIDSSLPVNAVIEILDQSTLGRAEEQAIAGQYKQLLMAYEVRYGRAHPEVREVAMSLTLCQVHLGQHKSAANLLWKVAEARRDVLRKLPSSSLGALDIVVSFFHPHGNPSKVQDLWDHFTDSLFAVTGPCPMIPSQDNTALRREAWLRLQGVEPLLERISKIRIAARHRIIDIRHYYAPETARDEIRILNDLCLAVDDLGITTIASALFREGFRLEIRSKKTDEVGSLDAVSHMEDLYSRQKLFCTWGDLECSILY